MTADIQMKILEEQATELAMPKYRGRRVVQRVENREIDYWTWPTPVLRNAHYCTRKSIHHRALPFYWHALSDLLCGGCLLLLAHAAAALTPGLNLLLKSPFTLLLNLESVNMLDQNTFVPELVTLGLKIELAIEMLVNFLLLAEVNKCAADNADTANPLPFVVEPRVLGTTALTEAPVTAGTHCEDSLPMSGL